MTLDERDNGLYRDKLHASESTYDPFVASHYEPALAEGLSSRQTRRRRLLAWIFLAIITFLWLAKPPFGAGAGAAAGGGH